MKKPFAVIANIAVRIGSWQNVGTFARAQCALRAVEPPRERSGSVSAAVAAAIADLGDAAVGVDMVRVADADMLAAVYADLAAGVRQRVIVAAGDERADIGPHAIALLLTADESKLPPADMPFAAIAGIGATTALESTTAIANAVEQAGLTAAAIGYAELADLGAGADTEEASIARRWLGDGDSQAAIGSTVSLAGPLGQATLLVGIARAAIALRDGQIFGIANWQGPSDLADWTATQLHFPTQSHPWLRPAGGARRAAIVCAHTERHDAAVALIEPGRIPATIVGTLEDDAALLMVVADAELDAVVQRMDALARRLADGEAYRAVAADCRNAYAEQRHLPLAGAIVARNTVEALRELKFLRQMMATVPAGEVRTPFGSCFAAQPLGPRGRIAFVYPGAGSAYPGLGQDLFSLFPGLIHRLDAMLLPQQSDAHRPVAALYPRGLVSVDAKQAEACERAVARDPLVQLGGSIYFAAAFTLVAREVLGIRADIAFGYCIGEVAMLAALGVWSDMEMLSESWGKSDVFQSRLYHRMTAVREAWKLTPQDPLDVAETWRTMVVLAGVAEIDAAIAGEPRVYRTIVNAPNEVVIAGDGAACDRVIARLGGRAVPMPFNMPVHCQPVASERAAIAACHRLPVMPQPGIEFLNLHRSPLVMEPDALAGAIADTYTRPVDFPVLVEQAYAGGARLFIELGARRMCSSWIDATLGKRPHASIPFDVKGAEPALTLLRAIARLTAHRVPLDLERLGSGHSARRGAPAVGPTG